MEIFSLIADAVQRGRADFFFDASQMCKSCIIDDLVFSFKEEEEGSFTVKHQNIAFLWIRETPGWEVIREALSAIAEDEDANSSDIKRRVYDSLYRRLNEAR